EAGRRDPGAFGIKPRRLERDVEGLPFARLLGGVDARRGMVVDAAAIAVFQVLVFLAKAVENLHFVVTHEVDAGVAALGDVEFDVQLAVAVSGFTDEIDAAAVVAVEEHTHAGLACQTAGHHVHESSVADAGPLAAFLGVFAAAQLPAAQILTVEERGSLFLAGAREAQGQQHADREEYTTHDGLHGG